MYFQHTGNSLGYSYKVVNSVNAINMIWIIFMELFDMCMYVHCSVTVVELLCESMFTVSSGIVIVKIYCSIKTRLEICSTRIYTGNLF